MIAVRHTSLGLRVSAFLSASVSLAALLAHVSGILPMAFFLTVFGVPSLFLLVALATAGRLLDEGVFVNCMAVGLVAGIVATIAYDLVRLLLMETHIFDYDSFKAILIFGGWITGTPRTTNQSFVAGWLYHYWNGVSFSIMYMMIFGRWHWLYGVGYGMVMELCMLGIFPMFLTITSPVGFVVLSLIGHAFYGAVIGRAGQLYARSWYEAM